MGVFPVVDYYKYNRPNLGDNQLGLWYDNTEKKVFLGTMQTSNDNGVYGVLRLTDTEHVFFAATLSAGQDIFECEWAFVDSNAPMEQKLRVSVWVKENTIQTRSAQRTAKR